MSPMDGEISEPLAIFRLATLHSFSPSYKRVGVIVPDHDPEVLGKLQHPVERTRSDKEAILAIGEVVDNHLLKIEGHCVMLHLTPFQTAVNDVSLPVLLVRGVRIQVCER